MRLEIRSLQARTGATAIYVTHDQGEALTMADHLVVMNEGRVVQCGTPAQIYADPQSRFVASFLGEPAVNLLPVSIAREGLLMLPDGRAAGLRAGNATGPCLLGIRPEDVVLEQGGLAAKVIQVENFGYRKIVHVLLGDARLAVSVAPPVELSIGMDAGIRFPAGQCLLFDRDGGARLSADFQPA